MKEINCSDSFCTALWWKGKYKTLRAASVLLGAMHRRNQKQDTKNWQRVVQITHDLLEEKGDLTIAQFKGLHALRSLALETIRERQ